LATLEEVHQRIDLDKKQKVDMDQGSHIFHIFAQMKWEVCYLFPQNQEEKVSGFDRGLSSPPSYLFGASSEASSPHEVLFQWHGENITCQIAYQRSF
jgi:hypothetical protein